MNQIDYADSVESVKFKTHFIAPRSQFIHILTFSNVYISIGVVFQVYGLIVTLVILFLFALFVYHHMNYSPVDLHKLALVKF